MHANKAATPPSTDEPFVRMPVDGRRFPWIRRLAADYAYDFSSVAPFFAGDPADRRAIRTSTLLDSARGALTQ